MYPKARTSYRIISWSTRGIACGTCSICISTAGDRNDRLLRQVKKLQTSRWGNQMPVYYIPDESRWQSCCFPRSLHPPEEPGCGSKDSRVAEQFPRWAHALRARRECDGERTRSSIHFSSPHDLICITNFTCSLPSPPRPQGGWDQICKASDYTRRSSCCIREQVDSEVDSVCLGRTRHRCFEWMLRRLRSSRVCG